MQRLTHFVSIVAALILAAFLVAGCASIMRGSKQKVSVNSSPAQAHVLIKTTGGMTVYEGKTPFTTDLSKKDEYMVTVSLEGYKDKTVNITKDGIEGWFWGNIICGGIIGIVVDVTSGAINKLAPDQINVELTTASLFEQGDQHYLIFYALDSQGQLRSLAVPLEKDIPIEFSTGGSN